MKLAAPKLKNIFLLLPIAQTNKQKTHIDQIWILWVEEGMVSTREVE